MVMKVESLNFNGIEIISNPAIPEGKIFVNPKEFIMLTDPQKWQELEEKATKDMLDKLALLNLPLGGQVENNN